MTPQMIFRKLILMISFDPLFNQNLYLVTHACMLSCVSHVLLFVTPWTVARQAPLSTGFSRQEHRSGLPLPPPGDLPDPGVEPSSVVSPALAGGFLTTSATWDALSGPKIMTFIYLCFIMPCYSVVSTGCLIIILKTPTS